MELIISGTGPPSVCCLWVSCPCMRERCWSGCLDSIAFNSVCRRIAVLGKPADHPALDNTLEPVQTWGYLPRNSESGLRPLGVGIWVTRFGKIAPAGVVDHVQMAQRRGFEDGGFLPDEAVGFLGGVHHPFPVVFGVRRGCAIAD